MIDFSHERRKHPRYHVNNDALAVLKPHPIKLGQIINISEGGLAFHYLGDEKLPDRYTELDIFITKGNSHYTDFQFIPVRDIEISNQYDKNSPIRQLSIQFNNLNEDQKKRLKQFIHVHVL